jgi:hypothetical protein
MLLSLCTAGWPPECSASRRAAIMPVCVTHRVASACQPALVSPCLPPACPAPQAAGPSHIHTLRQVTAATTSGVATAAAVGGRASAAAGREAAGCAAGAGTGGAGGLAGSGALDCRSLTADRWPGQFRKVAVEVCWHYTFVTGHLSLGKGADATCALDLPEWQ